MFQENGTLLFWDIKLFSPNIKKNLGGNFPSSKNSFPEKSKKISYIFTKKVFLAFWEIKPFGPKIKKSSYIFSKKYFSVTLGNRTFLKKLLKFQEETFQAHKIKKTHSEKISYIS